MEKKSGNSLPLQLLSFLTVTKGPNSKSHKAYCSRKRSRLQIEHVLHFTAIQTTLKVYHAFQGENHSKRRDEDRVVLMGVILRSYIKPQLLELYFKFLSHRAFHIIYNTQTLDEDQSFLNNAFSLVLECLCSVTGFLVKLVK